MTFSIVAYDPASRSWGVAVASKFLAVGAVVPWGRAGVGAVATQANANLDYGPDGLALLAAGASAEETVRRLTGADPGRADRQLGVVDAAGRAASYTGDACLDWAGGRAEDGIAVQGNILAGPQVVEAMVTAWHGQTGATEVPDESERFARRLLAALRAGDQAGGDRRGRESAALRVWRANAGYGGRLDLALDLRVDDHPDPVAELDRLLGLHQLYFGKPDPATLLPLDAAEGGGGLRGEVAAALALLGHDPASRGLEAALEQWAGIENLEERLVPGKLDPQVLAILRRRAQAARAGQAG
jgi:uncharacterized Ntn-hydrolase superfamily protein